MAKINRIKIALVEHDKTGKWLADMLNRDVATVSRWCSNAAQPSLDNLRKIADVLNMDIKDLLESTKKKKT
jgi:transcriptional regulator with XRE-family HTH domain